MIKLGWGGAYYPLLKDNYIAIFFKVWSLNSELAQRWMISSLQLFNEFLL